MKNYLLVLQFPVSYAVSKNEYSKVLPCDVFVFHLYFVGYICTYNGLYVQ